MASREGKYFSKDKAEHEKRAKETELRKSIERRELQNILATKSGRAVIWRIMVKGRPFDETFLPETNAEYFRSGQRSAALSLFNDVLDASPEAYHLMRKENGGTK